jgi:hypothetical protein
MVWILLVGLWPVFLKRLSNVRRFSAYSLRKAVGIEHFSGMENPIDRFLIMVTIWNRFLSVSLSATEELLWKLRGDGLTAWANLW